jgi:hypothetical protein
MRNTGAHRARETRPAGGGPDCPRPRRLTRGELLGGEGELNDRGGQGDGGGRRGAEETGETGRRGDGETGRRGDGETGRRGDGETGR